MNFIKRYADWLASLALLAVILFYAVRYVDFNMPPFEDAAMLMRYADHLAHGYGIVWNIGQHPVDGATDFLFMVASAALIKIGIPVGRSIRGIGFVSHILTVLLVYWVNRKIWKASIAVSFVTALYLSVGTGLSYVAAYFGTPFFALFAALTWTFCLLLIQKVNPPLWLSLLFAFVGLLTGLTRPEGVILAALMLIAIIVMKGWRQSAKTIFVFVGIFLILGGAYFLWRWNYFGYPLPNPFYKKGGGFLYWDALQASFGNVVQFGSFFLLAYLLGFRSTKLARQTIAFLIPVVGFAAAFVLISDEMNFGARFQYALLPIILLSWYPLVRGISQEFGAPAWGRIQKRTQIVLGIAALVVVGVLVNSSAALGSSTQNYRDGRYDVAMMLEPYAGKGYTMATTEAGLLPYYSQWNAIDAWGLNDQWIAHHGEITEAYLDQYKPELIIFHAHFSPLVPPLTPDRYADPAWFKMTIVLNDYAIKNHYILAAVFGDSPYDTHYYYVRPDFPDSQNIAHLISHMKKYYWSAEPGVKAINYANVQAP